MHEVDEDFADDESDGDAKDDELLQRSIREDKKIDQQV